jgi:hypothetical protein
MHSVRPQVVTVRWFTVFWCSGTTVRRRISAGSSPSSSAMRSRCTSKANRGWGVPWPRFGPQGGLLVKIRHPSNLYRAIR